MKNMGKPDKAGEWFEKTIGRGDIEANLNLAKIFLAYNLDICKAEGCLKNVVDSRAVTMGTKEEASYLLDMLDRASEWPKVGVSDKLGISA